MQLCSFGWRNWKIFINSFLFCQNKPRELTLSVLLWLCVADTQSAPLKTKHFLRTSSAGFRFSDQQVFWPVDSDTFNSTFSDANVLCLYMSKQLRHVTNNATNACNRLPLISTVPFIRYNRHTAGWLARVFNARLHSSHSYHL